MNEEQINTPNTQGEAMKMPDGTPATQNEKSVTNGPILVFLAILLLAILGGLYYWFSTLNAIEPAPLTERPTAEENNEPESTTAEAQTSTLDIVSTSDEIDAIDADLESTNLDTLDAELQAIDAELDAEVQAN